VSIWSIMGFVEPKFACVSPANALISSVSLYSAVLFPRKLSD
jgi:hypothetical protein